MLFPNAAMLPCLLKIIKHCGHYNIGSWWLSKDESMEFILRLSAEGQVVAINGHNAPMEILGL